MPRRTILCSGAYLAEGKFHFSLLPVALKLAVLFCIGFDGAVDAVAEFLFLNQCQFCCAAFSGATPFLSNVGKARTIDTDCREYTVDLSAGEGDSLSDPQRVPYLRHVEETFLIVGGGTDDAASTDVRNAFDDPCFG